MIRVLHRVDDFAARGVERVPICNDDCGAVAERFCEDILAIIERACAQSKMFGISRSVQCFIDQLLIVHTCSDLPIFRV
jgi:hypothetical protein